MSHRFNKLQNDRLYFAQTQKRRIPFTTIRWFPSFWAQQFINKISDVNLAVFKGQKDAVLFVADHNFFQFDDVRVRILFRFQLA